MIMNHVSGKNVGMRLSQGHSRAAGNSVNFASKHDACWSMNVAPSVRDRNEIWPMYSKFSLRSYCAPEARDVPEQQEGLKESDLCSKAGAGDGAVRARRRRYLT